MKKTFLYEPEAVKAGEFVGEVVLSKPSFDEKYELLEKYGSGLISNDGSEVDNIQSIKFARGLVKASEKYYEKVDLESTKSGEKYKSFADMSFEDECYGILIEVAKTLIMPKGVAPEKKSKSKVKSVRI